MKRKILFAAVILIVVAAIIIYRMYSQQTEDIVDQTADARITAKELIAAFEKDTAAARIQYVDKIIEVTGTVKKVDTSGSVVLGIEGTESGVVFGLDRRHMDDYKKISPGKQATLQGKCTGFTMEEMMGINLGTTVTLNFAGVKNSR